MKNYTFKSLLAGVAALFVALSSSNLLNAQSVIGPTTSIDSIGLRISKTGANTHPLQLIGIKQSTDVNLNRIVLANPDGTLYYKEAADLSTASEWSVTGTGASEYIYAKRAQANSRNIVINSSTGYMGIGNVNPQANLHITGTAGNQNVFRVTNLPETKDYAGTYNHVSVDANGNFYRTSYSVQTIPSDKRLKDIHGELNNTLDRISKLSAIEYNYKREVEPSLLLDDKGHYGLIAQEVKEQFPHLVQKNGEYYAVNYQELSGVLVAATKELHQQNKAMEAKLSSVEKQNMMLQNELEQIKTMVSTLSNTSTGK